MILVSTSSSTDSTENESDSATNLTDTNELTATLTQTVDGEIEETTRTEDFSETIIETEGGDQQIAATIADLYSPNFAYNLREWLNSVEEYPRRSLIFITLIYISKKSCIEI